MNSHPFSKFDHYSEPIYYADAMQDCGAWEKRVATMLEEFKSSLPKDKGWDVDWTVIINADHTSPHFNPLGSVGRFTARRLLDADKGEILGIPEIHLYNGICQYYGSAICRKEGWLSKLLSLYKQEGGF